MAISDKFKTGDLVRLKSGGPPMTISESGIMGDWHCTWFRGSLLRTGTFKEAMIERYRPAK